MSAISITTIKNMADRQEEPRDRQYDAELIEYTLEDDEGAWFSDQEVSTEKVSTRGRPRIPESWT